MLQPLTLMNLCSVLIALGLPPACPALTSLLPAPSGGQVGSPLRGPQSSAWCLACRDTEQHSALMAVGWCDPSPYWDPVLLTAWAAVGL